jgi:hypothetical protein
MILLALTGLIGIFTVSLGMAIVFEGVIHLLIFAAFLFIAVMPKRCWYSRYLRAVGRQSSRTIAAHPRSPSST